MLPLGVAKVNASWKGSYPSFQILQTWDILFNGCQIVLR
jgi:hypothetical protein